MQAVGGGGPGGTNVLLCGCVALAMACGPVAETERGSDGTSDANPGSTGTGDASCTDLELGGAPATLEHVPEDLPAPAGGEIEDGVYHLTALLFFTGPGGEEGPIVEGSIQETLRITGQSFEMVSFYNSADTDAIRGELLVGDPSIAFVPACGTEEERVYGDAYTADAEGNLTLFSAGSASVFTRG